MRFPITTMVTEWVSVPLLTIVLEVMGIMAITDITHTVTIHMDITHTVLSIPTEVTVTILMATVLADWVGVVTVMEMAGTETEMEMVGMEMAVDGEVQTEVVKHQMLHTIIVDLQVLELGILQPTDVAFFKRI